MSLTWNQQRRAHIALQRFGLGAKPGAFDRIGPRAGAALLAELNMPGIAFISDANLPSYFDACQAVDTSATLEYAIRDRELTARIKKHLEPEIGFVERLVLFFSNHFSMTVRKGGPIRATMGQLERDVIRKHALGSFKSMLLGVMRHPAMLFYLDNANSVGPNSAEGKKHGDGLNHNLAREVLELHTLGIGGGYSEQDVASLALILTGWSYVRGSEADGQINGGHPGNRGQFIFRPGWHEPGPQSVLGVRYDQAGMAQGIAALSALAMHPSTAKHLAFKLARHFVCDSPTPEMVDPVAAAFLESGGNIRAMARALIALPESWSQPLQKIRTPYEIQIAQFRATERDMAPEQITKFMLILSSLNHLPWQHPSPDGSSDETANWLEPNALRIRLETAQFGVKLLERTQPLSEPVKSLASRLYGLVLSQHSASAITSAPSMQAGMATLFMTPEFQRR